MADKARGAISAIQILIRLLQKRLVLKGNTASRLLLVGFLFVLAFSLRLYQIDEPPMDFAEVRQYHSALLARGFYEKLQFGEWETTPPDGVIEPPILEV